MTPTYSVAEYSVAYSNGCIQRKHLVSAEDYRDSYIIMHRSLAVMQETKSTPALKGLIASVKNQLREQFGDSFFVVGSPLHAAITGGELQLPTYQGGTHVVTLNLL